MNENLDLTKILDGCPAGTDFYHVVYGRVWFDGISLGDSDNDCFITFSLYSAPNTITCVTKKGTFRERYDGECLVFPSKDQRDWSKFERFWDKPKAEEPMVEIFDINTLKPFDKVLVRDFLNEDWMADFFERIDENDVHYNATCVTSHWEQCIPYNDETKHLLGTREDCPEYYKWWEAAQEKIAQNFLNKLKL